jgi:hypothetical protein
VISDQCAQAAFGRNWIHPAGANVHETRLKPAHNSLFMTTLRRNQLVFSGACKILKCDLDENTAT